MSTDENQATYGKCNNPYGHGHNYALEVTVSGAVDRPTGMICNLADLDGFVHAHVIARFEHVNLNTLREFQGVVPTTENLCAQIYDIMKHGFLLAHLEKVRLEETASNSFEYAGGAAPRH